MCENVEILLSVKSMVYWNKILRTFSERTTFYYFAIAHNKSKQTNQ